MGHQVVMNIITNEKVQFCMKEIMINEHEFLQG